MLDSLISSVMAIVLGASIGSFLNVVIYRLPSGLSILYPPSRCPNCLKGLSPLDNIPIIGWFLIKGKCRYCHQRVAWRYPFIECLTAFTFWFIVTNFMQQPLIVIVGSCVFVSYLIALAAIDIDTMTLPNPLTQSGLVMGIFYHVGMAVNTPTPINILNQAIASILGAVVGIWLVDLVRMLGFWLLQKEAMGAGDAKLAAMIGAWLGWQELLLTLLLAAVLGSLGGLLIINSKNSGKTQPYPFGPFLAIAAIFSLIYGEQILSKYLDWFGIV